jgi:hypothetical protein
MSTEASSQTVCFKIEGEHLTRLARTLWADELETTKALNLLVDGLQGITEAQAISILTGENKLVGCNDLDMVPDGATETEYGNKLALKDILRRQEEKKAKAAWEQRLFLDVATHNTVPMGSPYGLCHVPKCMTEPYTDVCGRPNWKLKEKFTFENIEQYATGQQFSRDLLTKVPNPVQLGNDPEPSKRPDPIEDKELKSESGWITEDGRFFGCAYMEHDAIAQDMGFEVKDVESRWIRISKGFGSVGRSPFMHQGIQPSQRQLDVLFDWCQKHNETFPTDIFEDRT